MQGDLVEQAATGQAPKKIGKYEILGEVGRGAMGVVYLGHDPFVDRKVAVKVCSAEGGDGDETTRLARKMFINEAQSAGNLDHPNILKVYDAGEDQGEPYIVMEYLDGAETLRVHCDRDHLLPVDTVITTVKKCAEALDYAHRSGVTHRDIKPANIMLTRNGDVKIVDDNLEALESADFDAYVATDKGEKKNKIPLDESNRKLTKSDFIYIEQDDCFTCPGGQTLSLKSESKDGKKTYQGSSDVCADCDYKSRCCKSAKGQARTINTDDKEPLRQQMNEKMESETSKEIYKKRKIIVEPVFGQIKNTGFRGFSVRGHKKTSGEFSLICTVHNLKKIMKAMFRGVVRSKSGELEPMPA